jgi:hypothetical protein
MRTTILVLATLAMVLALMVRSAEAQVSDTLVIAGAGVAGTWDTEFELSNTGVRSLLVWIGQDHLGPDFVCAPIVGCAGDTIVNIPPQGALKVLASSIGGITTDGSRLQMFIGPVASSNLDLPVTRARVIDLSANCRALELPIIRLSTIQGRNPSTLSFPGAVAGATGHVNLALAEIGGERGLSVQIEIIDAGGITRGTTTLSLDASEAQLLVNVGGLLGTGDLDEGTIQVTKTGGEGLLWGAMSTLFADSHVALGIGLNP